MCGLRIVVFLITVPIVAAQDCEGRWPHAFCTYMFDNQCPEGSTFTYKYCGYQKICCIPQSPIVPAESSCGKRMVNHSDEDEGAGRVLGGTPSYTGEWPWMVSLTYYDGEQYFGGHVCGGTIIGRHWILTVGHCFEEPPVPERWTVVTGEYDHDSYSGSETTYRVSNIYRHPLYDAEEIEYDIALLRVSTPIEYDDNVQPACLPDAGDDYTHNMCTLTGWGAHYHDGPSVDRLEKVTLPVISNSLCAYKHRTIGRIMDNHICVDHVTSGFGVCQGDSGGPLNCLRNGVWNVVGIFSWVVGCGEHNYPDVFVRVSAMLDWISNIQRS